MRKKNRQCLVKLVWLCLVLTLMHVSSFWTNFHYSHKKTTEVFTGLPETRQHGVAEERYIIYECNHNYGFCGGWGDRLSGIVMTYLISQITNRRFGISITSPSCNLTDFYQPNLIDWNIDKDSLYNVSYKRINHVDSHKIFYSINKINFSDLMTKNVIYYTVNYEFIPRLQENIFHSSQFMWMKKWTRDRVFAYVMRILFKLSKTLNTFVLDFMEKVRPNNKWKLMCAHIRMGRNPTIPRDTEIRNTPEEVELLWEFLKRNFTCDHCKVFIATDSEDIRKKAKILFPDMIVDIPGNITHIERGQDVHMCDSFSKVILDQHILSKCDGLVITKSGLGKIAAYLRGTDENLYCFYRKRIVKCSPNNINKVFHSLG